jgi:hypothetical protein
MTKEQIIKQLLKDFEKDYHDEKFYTVNDKNYTLADLMIRQFLNNHCNGFGMKRVNANYEWLKSIKDDLIKYDLVSKNAKNNFGFILWENYNF